MVSSHCLSILTCPVGVEWGQVFGSIIFSYFMAALFAASAVWLQREVELKLPLSVWNGISDVRVFLAGMDGMTSSASAAAILLVHMYKMQIPRAVSELGQSDAVFGRDKLAPVAVETQPVVIRVKGGVKQFGIRVFQKIEID